MAGYYSRLAEFKELISNIEYLSYTQNSLIYWDKLTYMPPGALCLPGPRSCLSWLMNSTSCCLHPGSKPRSLL